MNENNILSTFIKICNNKSEKQIEIIEKYYKANNMTKNDIMMNNNKALRIACRDSNKDLFIWLKNKCHIIKSDIVDYKIYSLYEYMTESDKRTNLEIICFDGTLDMMELLCELFYNDGIIDDIMQYFVDMCQMNRIEQIKFICDNYEISRDSAIDGMINGCIEGHLELVKYLHQEYEFTKNEMSTDCNYAYCYSVYNKHNNITRWLEEKWNYNANTLYCHIIPMNQKY